MIGALYWYSVLQIFLAEIYPRLHFHYVRALISWSGTKRPMRSTTKMVSWIEISEFTFLVYAETRSGLVQFDRSIVAFKYRVFHKNIFSAYIDTAPIARRLDTAIHRINRYSRDKCSQNKPRYPLEIYPALSLGLADKLLPVSKWRQFNSP